MTPRNDLMLRVARGEDVPRPPVWLMRQAGRFLSEYREVRAKAGSFKNMIANPEIAAEVTLQPVDLIGVDAAIIFSDILVIPEAIGLDYEMHKGVGPVFPETVRSMEGLKRLHSVREKSNLDDTFEALKIVRRELGGRVPLIGFAGAPWTLFCYMTEGGGSKTFSWPRRLLRQDPEFAHALLDMLTEATITYLKGQIAAGAEIVQVFDSWAGVLGRDMFGKFSLPYLARIASAITEVPVIVFAKGAFHSLDRIGALDCNVVGMDWTMEIDRAVREVPNRAFQGNMDPAMMYADRNTIKQATIEMLKAFPAQRLIANLGHGIYPDMPRDNVRCFVDTVKEFSYGQD